MEATLADTKIGRLLLEQEKLSLDFKGGPRWVEKADTYKENLRIVDELNEEWVFRADRANEGRKQEWYEPDTKRSTWKPIDVTKFWQKQENPDWTELEGARVGNKGIGWYTLAFEAPSEWPERELFLWFCCDEEANVWVNGQLVRHRNEGPPTARWHVPSLAPLSEELKPGAQNEIVIRIYNAAQAGGLWRGVRVMQRK